ncbi:MAG: SDR family oxidoreductase [Gammaproteobacteria bacterium]|jgi:NAD(P)-dependent dehydrogenase (short-subunit alcohol dehydrogenase family)|nr:SDR family oxidoreductase [Gammaproteobacteria bacterium]MBU1833830.1 SDR family oxidoreductase [Gammaproteobacteria bacterium]
MTSAPSPFDLKNKIALVSGGSRGIGKSICKALAAHGAHVIVASRKAADCEQVAEEIRRENGSAEAMACHIGEMAQIESVFEAIERKHGRLDILVNNAATNPYFGHITDTDLSAFNKTIDVNIRGYFFMSSIGIKLMAKNGGGSVINVASINGVKPGALQGIYSISKAAVISMTQAFAKECAAMGVRVNALLPGLTDTKFAATLVNNDEIREAVLKDVPLNRVAQPDEMAGAVLYLASSASSYTTGSCITVDGGYLS